MPITATLASDVVLGKSFQNVLQLTLQPGSYFLGASLIISDSVVGTDYLYASYVGGGQTITTGLLTVPLGLVNPQVAVPGVALVTPTGPTLYSLDAYDWFSGGVMTLKAGSVFWALPDDSSVLASILAAVTHTYTVNG